MGSLLSLAPSKQRSMSHQAGLGLVELMVGIVIGLLVVVAAVGSLAYMRSSSQTIGDSSRLQQNAAYALRNIGHQIRQSGARSLVNTAPGDASVEFNPDYIGISLDPTTSNPIVTQGTDGANGAPDTLQISYDTDRVLLADDCLGQPAQAPGRILSSFSVTNNELRCLGSGSTAELALLQGVEDLQILYGVRRGANLQYITATDMVAATPSPWDHVEAVQVCLRLAGELANHPGADIIGCNGENIAQDGRIRRVIMRTFKVRNQGL